MYYQVGKAQIANRHPKESPMTRFQQFVHSRFTALNPRLQSIYGDASQYEASFIQNHGFYPYLESLRCSSLSLEDCEDLAFGYMKHGNRWPQEIHRILAGIAHQFDVDLPVIEGILTADFWVDRAHEAGWPSAESKDALCA